MAGRDRLVIVVTADMVRVGDRAMNDWWWASEYGRTEEEACKEESFGVLRRMLAAGGIDVVKEGFHIGEDGIEFD